MTLLVKDANTVTQPISTQTDVQGNLVPVNVPASVVGTVATPVSAAAPLPVINAAGSIAVDGSGTVTSQSVAQTLFGGVVPTNGYMVCNNCATGTMWVIDGTTAANNVGFAMNASQSVVAGSIFITPSGYKPIGPVSIYGGATSGNFTARRW